MKPPPAPLILLCTLAHLAGLTRPSPARAEAAADVNFDLLFADQPWEVRDPLPGELTGGRVPAWLSGAVVRNGPGVFGYGNRSVVHAFDGSAKLQSWEFVNGSALFRTAFLGSTVREQSVLARDIAPQLTFDRLDPCFSVFGKLASVFDSRSDNYVVNLFRPGSSSRVLATSDVAASIEVDPATLATYGATNFTDGLASPGLKLGAAHPLAHGGSLVNVAVNMSVTTLAPRAPAELLLYRMGAGMRRRVFGRVSVPYAPYIHSFALTERYAVVVVFPVSFELEKVLLLRPLMEVFTWNGTQEARVHVFDLSSEDPEAAPVATFSAPPFFGFHHVNAFEEAATGDVLFDIAAYNDTSPMQGRYAFGVLPAMLNASTRYLLARPETRRYRLPMGAGRSRTERSPPPPASYTVLRAADASGRERPTDMPRINELRRGRPYCFFYALDVYSPPWSIVKVDVCRAVAGGGTTASVWSLDSHYPTEPIFVPRPGSSAEDDGVVLSNVLDGPGARTYMLILNATTMLPLATVYAPGGRVVPWNLHGQFFDLHS